ncbi:MAG: N-acetyl-gamma-glutamyl-phosphate reductase [Pseudomonadota bacterium]
MSTTSTSNTHASANTTFSVFIDGQAGTTGLGIADRLAGHSRIRIVEIADADRKSAAAKSEILSAVDLTILCLPDAAAKETVALADALPGGGPIIVDASTAHRVAEGWDYGFAELSAGQAAAIKASRRIANPGCYPTGAIALIRPLIEAGIITPDHAITINAVSGYSGGGRQMIEAYESGTAPPFVLYGLGLSHKHLPELQKFSGLSAPPIFVPSVGNFAQGMLVSIPLHLGALAKTSTPDDLRACLDAYFTRTAVGSTPLVSVPDHDHPAYSGGRLAADDLAETNAMELFVFGNRETGQAVLVARLDNLGKGASGAAVQNMELALGLA